MFQIGPNQAITDDNLSIIRPLRDKPSTSSRNYILPSLWTAQRKTVKVVKDVEIRSVSPEEVDYIVPTATEMYSEITNLVPFLSSNSGGRAILGTAQMVQAVPLKDPEVPLVRANNFESAKAFRLGMEAPTGGRIVKVTKDLIKLKSDKTGKIKTIPLYNDMPLNRGGFLDAKSLVKKGDRVEKNSF